MKNSMNRHHYTILFPPQEHLECFALEVLLSGEAGAGTFEMCSGLVAFGS